jgi:signal transduction histidine kinase
MERRDPHWLAERRLAALDVLEVGTFAWVIGTHVLEGDEPFHRMLGLRHGASLHVISDLLACVHEGDRLALANALEQSAAVRADLHIQVRVRHPDGTVHRIEIRGRPSPTTAEREQHLVGVALDVTEQQRPSADPLAVVAHELRTPLNAIAGYTNLLLEGFASPVTRKQADYLRRIDKSYRHMTRVIEGVLMQARADAGKVEYHIADVPVGQILDRIEPLTAPQRAQKRFAYDCSGCDRRMVLHADMDLVVQIVLNLLSNAMKFTPPQGSITLRTEPRPPTHGALQVRDTGVGMSRAELDRLFEPYTQFAAGLKERGTGLGLSISRDLARGMAGEITAESEPGGGSVFTLTLPLAAAVAAA